MAIFRELSGGPLVRTLVHWLAAFTAEDPGSIPDWGTKIEKHSQNKTKKVLYLK